MAMYTVETSDLINDFPWWSGARETIADIIAANKEEDFNQHMEEMMLDGDWTDTQVNDYVWHDRESVYEACGLDENGELPSDEDEDEDEDGDPEDEPLTLTVDGRPMTDDEAAQLRDTLYYDGKADSDLSKYELPKYEYPFQIPNSILNSVYGDVSFTSEDFACNCE